MLLRGFVCLSIVVLICTSNILLANSINDRRIPNEYEAVGGHSLGFGNAGVAAVGGLSAIRVNPAMLSVEPSYNLFAGYNWPTTGRDFYQVGVVDAKTTSVAAGILYTGFFDDYHKARSGQTIMENDSPVKHRFNVAFAKNFSSVALGMNVQYVEAYPFSALNSDKYSGTSLSIGAVGLLTPQLRFGISAENLANSKIKNVAPQTLRTGIAYHSTKSRLTAHLDYRHRKRVMDLESDYPDTIFNLYGEQLDQTSGYDKPEQMLIGSFSVQVYDVVRLLGGYGQNVTGPERKSVSGGIAFVQGGSSISYTVSQPYMAESASQQALNLSFALSF